MHQVDLSTYNNTLSRKNQIARFLFTTIWTIAARPLPRSVGRKWKIFLLRLFGAKIHSTANIYSSVKIYMPWNLEMAEYSCLAPEVDCYNVDKIKIGANSTVSQKTYLCTASHDVTKSNNPLIIAPIIIEDQVWIGASAYINMGLTIGQGSVVGATASVYKSVGSWTIVGGNPAKFIKYREISK
ncbi:DapH/DapD/GlmU-related protein [Christiangramia salexigens]|uniref:Putative colanic acid biosynthesis acetyltransferase n=1 Tax=Christiangramia salexigens TaxID=1913577 RepID=A0A1L3J5N2_9FLAO|nr:DapH/DapD/GlmU-related protein [Christiangramia salexigens]APG60423.1 putative colanic acid biosynthesis acetyltransferase [Christiangramia salexigens]